MFLEPGSECLVARDGNDVARHLLESGKDPGTPKALHKLVSERWNAELDRTAAGWALTVVERD